MLFPFHANRFDRFQARRTSLMILWLWIACHASGQAADSAVLPERIEFNRDIRPILSDKCFACHGPDKNKREAELRLDTEAGLHGKDSGGVIVAGDPAASKLIHRIEANDEMERMPPKDFGKELDDTERLFIRRWIEQGAKWQGHWSFLPLKQPAPPKDAMPRFANNAIDRFVIQSMTREGLSPSPPESPRTIIRRLSFDLQGLPPDPKLVEAWAADPSPQAYERLVDELIASPHFGERLAVWWLDLVRYADSVGYHGDQPVKVSPFRDYVIQSFNANKRFDQFTIEQLAGDLLPDPTLEQQIASGYNRLGMMSAEGGAQAKEYLSKYASERVRNLSGAWLGVTIGCCECHDHKYDPFTTREFYQLESFFADIQEQGVYDAGRKQEPWGPEIQVPSASQRRQQLEIESQLASVRKQLDTPTPELDAAQRKWEASQVVWQVARPNSIKSMHEVHFQTLEDGSVLASGPSPGTDTYEVQIDDAPANLTAIRLEVLPHDSLPNKGPGRAGNGNFVLSEFEVYWRAKSPAENLAEVKEQGVSIQRAAATYEQVGAAESNPYKKWAVAAAIDHDEKGPTWGWAIMEQAGKANTALFELSPTSRPTEPGTLRIVLKQNLDNPQHTLGHFRFSVTTQSASDSSIAMIPTDIEAIRVVDPSARNDEQKSKLAAYYRSIATELEPQRKELSRLQIALEQLTAQIPTTLVTKRVEPRMIRVLARGNWMDDKGDVVQPGFPGILGGPTSEQRMTRLDLAKWVVAPENPLTARVLVNRMWKLFFGAGLSRKLDDLGAQGEWPSHPELLDLLAHDLIESGWDIKRLVKQIVMSETYRQSSAVAPQVHERDPYNRWLSHQGRWRLDAEFVRDNALMVSGLLKDKLGGDSVRPYQPARYWAYLNFPTREWQNSAGEELYRRSLYTHWQRQYLHPSLMAFDAPGREECIADRSRSNTPLQALVLLNDPIYVESSRVFALRTLECGESTDEQKIGWAIGQCLGRPARDKEIQILKQLLAKHRIDLAKDSASVDKLLGVGDSKVPASVDRTELAAWTSVARALFNLHESITRN
jgi:hypothetical protein